jgi:hypothetical protein
MFVNVMFRPLAHGALGYWDELANLIPLVIGGVLLIYLYVTSKKRRAKEKHSEVPPGEPPAKS